MLSTVGQFEAEHPGSIGAIAFWSGNDNAASAPTKVCGKMDPQKSYLEWLLGAHIVPHDCPRQT